MKLEDHDKWFRRFNLVEGKPRVLFSSSEMFCNLMKRVENEVAQKIDELTDQVRLFRENVFDDRLRHTMFSMYCDETDPSYCYLAYSSLAVEAIMSARYKLGSIDKVRTLLQTSAPK